MNLGTGILLLAGLQILVGLLPVAWFHRQVAIMRQLVTVLAGMQAILAMAAVVSLFLQPLAQRPRLYPPLFDLGDYVSFQYASTTGLMFLLISFIGWITCRYSIRYLDGDEQQGRTFKWMSFTIGNVGAMVLSADLLTFGLFWSLTSFGLHHLLLHFKARPAAQRAAWTKFFVSRLGDVAVLLAICLYYPVVGSLRFTDLASAAIQPSVVQLPAFQMATIALAIGVIVKTAQIPFHTWLPLTMETPTPISALMHAGIVNAGGFLLVRSSPLLGSSATAQVMLIAVGTATACLASVVMLTQTSIKKKLAYSTVAQMGFMLMQCGLAAYSAALLHILAHSLYKAHEFLSSGSIIAKRAATQTTPVVYRPVHWSVALIIMVGLASITWFLFVLSGRDPIVKPGGWLLIAILCAALTTWLVSTLTLARWVLFARACFTAAVLTAFYVGSFSIVDSIVMSDCPLAAQGQLIPGPAWPVMLFVLVPFAGLFLLQLALMSPQSVHRLRHWQIHAANGFYIESWLRRRFQFITVK